MTEHVAPQEDQLELHKAWLRLALPGPSNGARRPVDLNADAPTLYAERMQDAPEALRLANRFPEPYTDHALTARASAYLEGETDHVGAAVVAELLEQVHSAEGGWRSKSRSGTDTALRGQQLRRDPGDLVRHQQEPTQRRPDPGRAESARSRRPRAHMCEILAGLGRAAGVHH